MSTIGKDRLVHLMIGYILAHTSTPTNEQDFNIVRGIGSNDELVVAQISLSIVLIEHGGIREVCNPADVVDKSYDGTLEHGCEYNK